MKTHGNLRHVLRHGGADRRAFLTAGGLGFCGLMLPGTVQAAAATGSRKLAKSAILIWLTGGPSHVDLWDMKPKAAREFRGEFNPIFTSAPGIELSEHLPYLAKQAHHLAIVRSLGHYNRARNDHHTGYFYNLTGHPPEPPFLNSRKPKPDDWPFLGCVVGAKRPPHPYLPNAITVPQMAGKPVSPRPGQFAARLGVQHDALVAEGDLRNPLEFKVPLLTLQTDVTRRRMLERRQLFDTIDQSHRDLDRQLDVRNYSLQQQKAFSLLSSEKVKNAFDVRREPESVRQRYGSELNGMSMLLARRLVDAGVPFVTLFWKQDFDEDKANGCLGGAWDTHWKNFECLKNVLVPKFDRPFATLLDDLDERGLLDETLVIVTSEMGRTPKIGDRRSGGTSGSGRDHWTHCMSTLFAGGGIRGGQVYGSSDAVGAYPADNPVEPEDITRTIYHAMGITDLTGRDPDGRTFNLMDGGEAITALF